MALKLLSDKPMQASDHWMHFQKSKHLLGSKVSWCNHRLAQTPTEAFSAWGQSSCQNYCNRTNFRTRFNFVYFVLLTESTKFSSIRKPYTYACVSDTTVAVRKFLAYESWQTLEYEIFTRTKISAITVNRWILKLTASHLQILNQEIILITMVKKMVKKEFRKMTKKWNLFLSPIDNDENAIDCETACDCVKRGLRHRPT